MPSAGFELAITTIERLQTHALDRKKNEGLRVVIRDVSWENSRENIPRKREYSENILRKIILREYLRIFSKTKTWIFLNTLKIWRIFQDPIVNVYVPQVTDHPQVYPPNSWQCSRATVAAQLLVARII
jgi:hypothetical protein